MDGMVRLIRDHFHAVQLNNSCVLSLQVAMLQYASVLTSGTLHHQQ